MLLIAAPRVIRTLVLVGSDSGIVSRKPSKMGRPAQRELRCSFSL